MQGDPDVLKLLNEQLTSELTAINQYFLHSKMQANWGFTEIAEHTRKESFEEMQHAEEITNRILILDGLPNYQRLFSLRVGQTLRYDIRVFPRVTSPGASPGAPCCILGHLCGALRFVRRRRVDAAASGGAIVADPDDCAASASEGHAGRAVLLRQRQVGA